MKLKSIKLTNYRCFKDLEVNFDSKMTVLISGNSSGKTTVIDAVRIALWPFVKAFDLCAQTGAAATINIHDANLTQRNNKMEPVIPSSVAAKC